MKQFPNLSVATFETDEGKNDALDRLLHGAGVQRVGRLTVVSAFREDLAEAARPGGRSVLAAANVVIVGNIMQYGEGPVSSSHVGNEALVELTSRKIAYPLGPVMGWGRDGGPYHGPIPAVTLGYGEDSENAAYARATEEYNVYPYGGGAPARLERAFTAASRILGLE